MIRARSHPDLAVHLGILALLLTALCTIHPPRPPIRRPPIRPIPWGSWSASGPWARVHAGLLKTFAKDDTATLARGIALYAQAEADFNALIETLKAGADHGGEGGEGRISRATRSVPPADGAPSPGMSRRRYSPRPKRASSLSPPSSAERTPSPVSPS